MSGDRSTVERLGEKRLRGSFWHQGPTRYGLCSVADPAVSEGRYHRRGGPGVWYASDQERAAWAELFRHFVDAGVDPAEVRRRIGKVRVEGLTVLDLTSERVADAVGLDQEDLTGDDYGACQAVAVAALQAGFGGILAPSAALPGRRTLAVFPSGMACVVPVWSRVRQAPPRLAALRPVIPPLGQRPRASRAGARAGENR